MPRKAVTDLQRMKAANQRIVFVTAYDYSMARLVDAAGVDAVLVGDSLGMVFQGADNTLGVTLEQMIYHARAVDRGLEHAHLVVDMPFMTYQVSPEQALENAGRLVKEGGAQSVKLEGGERVVPAIRAITGAGIPVVAHLGLTPQSIHALGGYKLQGRGQAEAERLLREARLVQEAGASLLVLEMVPAPLARRITESLDIPTIGIGAGAGCDGQVLVVNDLLGMDERFRPRFVKRYAHLESVVVDAVRTYAEEVRSGAFPDEAHSFQRRRSQEVTRLYG